MTSILDQLTKEEFQDMMENVNASQLRVLLEADRKKNAYNAKVAILDALLRYGDNCYSKQEFIDIANSYENNLLRQAEKKGGE